MNPAARAVIAALALGVLIALLALVPSPSHERCEISGHLRTTVVECE